MPLSTSESTASSSSGELAYTPRFCSIQSQLVRSELFSYCPMRIHLNPASNMRVHHQRFQGKYGSRGRSELRPKPSSICEVRLGGTFSGSFLVWAGDGTGRNRIHAQNKDRM